MTFDESIGLVLSWCARSITGTSGRWVNCEPSVRQRIYYANHSSHLDIIILWSALPREIRRLTRPVAARDYWEKTAGRRYLAHRVFNAIMIDRAGHGGERVNPFKVIDDTIAGMGNDHSLIIFPEGTRGEGEDIAPFKGGIYELAKRKPGVELVPVYLENLNRILPKGEVVPVPLLSSISFGPAVVLGETETKREFLSRTRQAILDLEAT